MSHSAYALFEVPHLAQIFAVFIHFHYYEWTFECFSQLSVLAQKVMDFEQHQFLPHPMPFHDRTSFSDTAQCQIPLHIAFSNLGMG